MLSSYYQTYKKVCAPTSAFHKNINLGPVNLYTLKPFLKKKVPFPLHYNYIELHVVFSPLVHSY